MSRPRGIRCMLYIPSPWFRGRRRRAPSVVAVVRARDVLAAYWLSGLCGSQKPTNFVIIR
jgi:hypothetical protein